MQLASMPAPEEFELEEGSDQTSDQEAGLLQKKWTSAWPKWSKTAIVLAATALVGCVGLSLWNAGQAEVDTSKSSNVNDLIMKTLEQEEEFDEGNWVMVHLPAVCRAHKKDLRVFTKPGDTFAAVCKKGPCIEKKDMNPHTCAVMCQNRRKSGKSCEGMEYRMSENRCELRDKIGSFVNLDDSEKYPEPDFACLLYKPSCETLKSFLDHGAQSHNIGGYYEHHCD